MKNNNYILTVREALKLHIIQFEFSDTCVPLTQFQLQIKENYSNLQNKGS